MSRFNIRPWRWLRFQFKLRTLLIVMTLASVLLGTLGVRTMKAKRQRDAVNRLTALGGAVRYSNDQSTFDQLLRKVFGNEQFDFGELTALMMPPHVLTDADTPALAELTDLTLLDLGEAKITDASLIHIAHLKKLGALNLSDTSITSTAPLSNLRELAILVLVDTPVSDLSALRSMPRLTRLLLDRSAIDGGDLADVAKCRELRELSCNHTRLAGGAQHLSQLKSLTTLNLIGASIGDEGAAHLSGLANLEQLELRDNALSGSALASIAGLRKLKSLDLGDNEIDDQGLSHLAHLTALEKLSLEGTLVTDAGLAHLADLKQLVEVDLEGTRVEGPGLAHLAGLPQLGSLNLFGLPVEDEHIATLTSTRTLIKLVMWNGNVTRAGVERLQAALPNLEVQDASLPPMSKQTGGLF